MCLPCRDCITGRDRFARGTAKYRLQGIMHHAKTSSHAHSTEAMSKKDRELDYGCEQIHRGQAQELTCSSASVVAQQNSSSIFVARVLVETRGAFSNYKSWVESAQTAGSSTIVCDRKRAQKKVQVLASFEPGVTCAIAKAATFSDWQRTGCHARTRLR